jgi:hypothetical protein
VSGWVALSGDYTPTSIAFHDTGIVLKEDPKIICKIKVVCGYLHIHEDI